MIEAVSLVIAVAGMLYAIHAARDCHRSYLRAEAALRRAQAAHRNAAGALANAQLTHMKRQQLREGRRP